MRSSKSRSRSKGNRNRSVGNIVNRVFDSSGPEGKVRGTPQQIIEKYNQLTRDAQLSNDRVAAENFQQHAEHYLRMLAEAQKEMQDRQQFQQGPGGGQGGGDQPQSDAQQGGSQQRDDSGGGRGGSQDNDWRDRNRNRGQSSDNERPQEAKTPPDVIDIDAASEGGLVETPEDKPKRPRRPRAKPEAVKFEESGQPTPDAAE